jgi:uncharacterized membrane protein HdeD (DUF308 family)
MNALKYLGVIILIIGVLVLAVPYLTGGTTNALLITGMVLIVVGYLSHIFLNKRFL